MVGALGQRFGYGDRGVKPFENLFTFFGSYTTHGPSELFLSLEKTGIGPMDLRGYFEFYGWHTVHQSFYGLGSQSERDSDLYADGYYFYRRRNLSLKGALRKQVTSSWDIEGGLTGVTSRAQALQENSSFHEAFQGAPQTESYVKIGLGAVSEKRDSEFIPSRGHYLSGSAQLAPAALGSAQSWARADLDFRKYLPLLPDRWLWIATQLRWMSSTSATPLNEMPRLGSFTTLRGLPLDRYVGSHAITLRGELRSIFVRTLVFDLPLKGGLGVFADSGRVGNTYSELLRSPQRVAYGISAIGSYFTDDFLGAADLGFSQDGVSLYLKLGHSF